LIDTGGALRPESRMLLLDMMYRCRTGSNRIRGILPPGARVENKTGTLSGYTGDVGYLTSPTGRRIAVVFFGRGGENRSGVIATAARRIYDAFAEFSADSAAVVPASRSVLPYPVKVPERARALVN
jgi:beta-lactamase class A